MTAPTATVPTSSPSAEASAEAKDAADAPLKASSERLEIHIVIDTAIEGAQPMPIRIFPLETGDYSIGRTSLARKIKPSIPADGDDGVSHKHALIREQGESFAIMDLGSSNGTKLNGLEIIPNTVHTLKKDDVIAIGRWTLLTVQSRKV